MSTFFIYIFLPIITCLGETFDIDEEIELSKSDTSFNQHLFEEFLEVLFFFEKILVVRSAKRLINRKIF